MARTTDVIAKRTESVRLNLDRHRVRQFKGQAKLLPGPAVLVRSHDGSERTLRANVVLLATGSRPLHPPDIPFDDPDVHDSESIIGLRAIPRSIIVIGGGPVGCEYASVFTALGVSVTLLDVADRLVPFMDAEISDVLAQTFARLGMRVVLRSGVATVERSRRKLQVVLAGGSASSRTPCCSRRGGRAIPKASDLKQRACRQIPAGGSSWTPGTEPQPTVSTRPATSSAHQR
jgi:NAD(P) transhydrogenase